jgi:hypothetical protein
MQNSILDNQDLFGWIEAPDGWRVVDDDDDDNNQSVGEPQAEGVMSTEASFSLS